MASIGQRLWKAGNMASVWVYRGTGGKLGGRVRGVPVLLLTVAGRRTGAMHTTPVGYFEQGWRLLPRGLGGRATQGAAVDPQSPLQRDGDGADRPHAAPGHRRGPQGRRARQHLARSRRGERPVLRGLRAKSGRRIAVARLTPTG